MRTTRNRRGYMLLQVILVAALTGLLLNMSVRILNQSWKLEQSTKETDRQRYAYDHLVKLLNSDLENASEVNITRRILLFDKHLIWKVQDQKITRKSDNSSESWDLGKTDITFEKTNYGIAAKIDEPGYDVRKIPLIKTRDWAKSAVSQ